MKFTFIQTRDLEGSHWQSGYYTIRFYEYTTTDASYKSFPHYRAYYQSMSIDRANQEYLTLDDAMEACEEHYRKEEDKWINKSANSVRTE